MNQLKTSLSIAIISVLLIAFSSCKEDNEDPLPTTTATVITGDVSNIAATTATASGQVTDDGNATVSERGVVIGATANPTITDTKVLSGSGEGTFTADLTGLTAGTSYHIRAFATNAEGTSYGLDKSFITSSVLPTITTAVASSITAISAVSGGNVVNNGGAIITASGICWSTSSSPTTANSKTSDGTGSGSFISNLAGLNSSTKYYVRAYATNSVGTAYGNEISFTTLSPVPTNNLVGWWPFNGNANDESGNASNGTVTGATLTADRNGNSNKAYSFPNLSDYIGVVNPNKILTSSSFSVSLWFKLAQQYTYSSLFLVRNGTPYSNGYFLSVDQNDGAYGANNYRLYFCVGSNSCTTFTTNQAVLGNWTNMVGVFTGPETKLYVNGTLVNTQSASLALSTSNSNLLFSKWDNPSPPNFPSRSLDDIAIYNRALTADEIKKVYDGTGF